MGCLPSTCRRHEYRDPAIFTVDALAERETGKDETPTEVRDGRGQTALHRAAEVGDAAAVRRLLAAGACVNAADDHGRTPLMAAAGADAAAVCALLADAGADVGARDRFAQTALHVAAERGGGAEVVQLLLRRGTDPRVQDICRRSALHCALQACNLEASRVLLPVVGPLLQQDDTGRTELHCAAASGTPEMVRQLIARTSGGGSDRDCMGMTPLARALQALNRDTAAVLVMEACPCEPAADAFGWTELHWAAYVGYPEVVRQLMRLGFSPWVLDLSGRDVVHWAVESGDRQVVGEILEGGDFRESVDRQGQTALHLAAIRGDAVIAALLLDRGADATRVDTQGRIPVMYALRGARMDAALLLLTRCPGSVLLADRKKRTLLHWAAVGGDVDCVRRLLALGAPINAVDAQCKTPASLAVDHGHKEAATVLIGTEGFRVIHDREGRTPLHGVARAGWTQLAMQLLALGAHPYDGGCDNLSPVMLAMRAGHYSLARAIEQNRWSSE